MPKPPATPPDSLTDGVHQDRRDNVDAAIEAGQDAGDLDRARDQSPGRPNRSKEKSADDRSG
jgi:hypothetical protein